MVVKAKVTAKWGLNVHPSLLELAKVIHEDRITRHGVDTPVVVARLTVKFPTLEEVQKKYGPHFAALRARGDKRAAIKEKVFYAAIQWDLEALGPDRILVVEQPFVEL